MRHLNWVQCRIWRLAGASTVLVVLTACSASPPPISAAESASSSASAVAEKNSAIYGTSGVPPTTAEPTTPDITTADTSATGKFTKTWARSYSDTTCKELRTVMTGQQAFVAAADMLVNARVATDSSLPFPSDDLINMFENDILTGCDTDVSSADNIVNIATSIILIDNKQNYLK